MKINFKNTIRISVAATLSIFLFYGTYNLYEMWLGDTEYSKKLVYGVVTDKFESSYSCGKRSICYSRYLVINNKSESVNLDTYLKSRKGAKITLIYSEKIRNQTTFQMISALISFAAILLLFLYLICRFIYWLLGYED